MSSSKEEAVEKVVQFGDDIISLTKSFNMKIAINPKRAIVFWNMLSRSLKAGLVLSDFLDEFVLCETGRFRNIIKKVSDDIKVGMLFSDALAVHSHVFDDVLVNLVRTGENIGDLKNVCPQIVEYAKMSFDIKSKTKQAIRYPAIVLCVVISAIVILCTFLVEPMVKFMRDSNIELSTSTKFIVMMMNDWIFVSSIFLSIVIVFILLKIIVKHNAASRMFMHKFCLSIPIIGGYWKNKNFFYFAYSLSVLLKHHVQLITALAVAKKTLTNMYIERSVDIVIEKISSGSSMAAAFNEEKIFDKLSVKSVSMAEKAACLDEAMQQLSEIYYAEFVGMQETLLKLLEPVLLAALGGVIIFLIYGTIVPIYESAGNLRG